MAELNKLASLLAEAKFYYRFESGALTTDSSGRGHTLTAISDPASVSGLYGGAVELDANDAFSIVDHADLKPTGAFSLVVRFKVSGSAANYAFYQNQRNPGAGQVRGILTWISASGAVYFRTGTSTAFNDLAAGSGYNDGQWHTAIFEFNGTTKYIYIDDVLVNSVGWANTIGWDTVYPRIGVHTDNGSTNVEFLNGILDDMALFHRLLTADEKTALYVASMSSRSPMFFRPGFTLG